MVSCTDPALWALDIFSFDLVQAVCGPQDATESVRLRQLRAMNAGVEGTSWNDVLVQFDGGRLLAIIISL